MTDNIAILDGYTEKLELENAELTLYLLIRPGTDTDGTFRAWCCDGQEFINVNGWLFS